MQYETRNLIIPASVDRKEHFERIEKFEKENPSFRSSGAGYPDGKGGTIWPYRKVIPGTRLISTMTENELRQIIREELNR